MAILSGLEPDMIYKNMISLSSNHVLINQCFFQIKPPWCFNFPLQQRDIAPHL